MRSPNFSGGKQLWPTLLILSLSAPVRTKVRGSITEELWDQAAEGLVSGELIFLSPLQEKRAEENKSNSKEQGDPARVILRDAQHFH